MLSFVFTESVKKNCFYHSYKSFLILDLVLKNNKNVVEKFSSISAFILKNYELFPFILFRKRKTIILWCF